MSELPLSIRGALYKFCQAADNPLTLAEDAPSPSITEALLLRGLQFCELFHDWDRSLLESLAASARLQRYSSDAQLASGGLHVVVSGSIEMSGLNEQGEKFILTVLGPGEVTGLFTLGGDLRQRNYTCLAREEAVLIHLPSAVLRTVLDKNPIHWRAVAIMALGRNEKNILQMERRALASIPERIAQAIMRLAQFSGRAGQHGEIKLRISQADLAAMVSVSRQTVNQELGALSRKGIIAMKYGELTILDIGAVRELRTAVTTSSTARVNTVCRSAKEISANLTDAIHGEAER